jgi:hypothetical protein
MADTMSMALSPTPVMPTTTAYGAPIIVARHYGQIVPCPSARSLDQYARTTTFADGSTDVQIVRRPTYGSAVHARQDDIASDRARGIDATYAP